VGRTPNAADGGLDVRVALPAGAAIDGFVPRPATGFQTKLIGQFSPMAWAGPHVSILQSNAKLLDELLEHPDPAVRQFVPIEKVRLAELIKTERDVETLIERQRDERFE
jgi:hypothetical protein